MRHISFAITTPQFLANTKRVTRRMGWESLKEGTELCVVEKGQGLKKGEKVKKLGTIRAVYIRRERLDLMTMDLSYGVEECRLEGFPGMTPGEFVEMFCKANRCIPSDVVTRIEFEKIKGEPIGPAPL